MPDDPLVALALRLTDGESIDWKAESQSGSVDLSLLQILKQIEAVARAHEGADSAPGRRRQRCLKHSSVERFGVTWKSLN